MFYLHYTITFFVPITFFVRIAAKMNKNYTEKIFNHVQQNEVIISNFFCKFDINQL